jgi:hypothetical protein
MGGQTFLDKGAPDLVHGPYFHEQGHTIRFNDATVGHDNQTLDIIFESFDMCDVIFLNDFSEHVIPRT